MKAFHISATSLQSHQTQVDTIANNLANASTAGFKKSKVDFGDLVSVEMDAMRDADLRDGQQNSVGIGAGVRSIEKVVSQGDLKSTGRYLDLAIEGRGYFEVQLPDGSLGYTRSGHFSVDADGFLITPDGYVLSAQIQVPEDAKEVVIRKDGMVVVQLPDEDRPVEIGRIELAAFINPEGLSSLGSNLLQATELSGDALYGEAGQDAYGSINQGFLEGSNVDLIEEISNMMLARRGYEMNAKVIQTADEMLGIVNSLRR